MGWGIGGAAGPQGHVATVSTDFATPFFSAKVVRVVVPVVCGVCFYLGERHVPSQLHVKASHEEDQFDIVSGVGMACDEINGELAI
jgi:hypothetical protein